MKVRSHSRPIPQRLLAYRFIRCSRQIYAFFFSLPHLEQRLEHYATYHIPTEDILASVNDGVADRHAQTLTDREI